MKRWRLAALAAGGLCVTGAFAGNPDATVLFHFDAANLPEGGTSAEAFADAGKMGGGTLQQPLALVLSDPEAIKVETIGLGANARALRIQLPKPAEGKVYNGVSIAIQDNAMGAAMEPDKPLNIELKFRRSAGGMSMSPVLIFVQDSARINLSLGSTSLSASDGGMFFLPAGEGGKSTPAGQIPDDELVTLTFRLVEASGRLSLSVKAVTGSGTLFEEQVAHLVPPPVGETSSEGRALTLHDLRGISLAATVQAASGDLVFLDILSFRAWQ